MGELSPDEIDRRFWMQVTGEEQPVVERRLKDSVIEVLVLAATAASVLWFHTLVGHATLSF